MKDISTMTHDEAGGLLRRLEYQDEGDPTVRLDLALRALETSPEMWKHVWRKRVELYRSGRWVRVKRSPVENEAEELGKTEGD